MKKMILIALIAVMLISCNDQKTAYVDNTILFEEYKEMQDVEADFSSRSNAVRQELDSVSRVFQQEVQEYQEEMNDLSNAEREEREQELMQKQQMIQQQQQSVGGQLQQESQAVMDSVINNVKDYIEEYGKENGYTYIFGSDNSNIMYAEEGRDITDEILKELNERYSQN